jgi:hypothetical protein
MSVSFLLPGDMAPIRVQARVAWRNPQSRLKGCGSTTFNLPPGLGLEFLALASGDRDRIDARVKTTVNAFAHAGSDPHA